MTAVASPVDVRTPADLQRVMNARFPVSEEQWPAVSAPLEPTVVIAGAGSGKTTLMAARVVFLVATGARPRTDAEVPLCRASTRLGATGS